MQGKTSAGSIGIRLLLIVIIVLGQTALDEMSRERRREQLIAELDANGAEWRLFNLDRYSSEAPNLWREQLGAWLRGKPMVPHRDQAMLPKGTSPEKAMEFLDLFPTVRSLELDGGTATPLVLDELASYGPLERLRIYSSLTIDDDTARRLARIDVLAGIALQDQQCTDGALQRLAAAGANIEEYSGLDRWQNVGDEGLKAAAQFPENTYVWASCRGTDEGIKAQFEHPSLHVLYLNGPNYTDASAKTIAGLPSLIELHISATGHTDAGLAKAIAGCSASYIELNKVAVGDRTIAALRKAPELITLRLVDVELTAEQYGKLAKLPVDLDLKGDTLTDEQVARLAPMARGLSTFSLDAPQVTDAGLAWLKNATRLVALDLENTKATSATWSLLPRPEMVERAGMGGPNFSVETLRSAEILSKLKAITLTGSNIDDATLDGIPESCSIVSLNNTRVTDEGLQKLGATQRFEWINLTYDENHPSLVTADGMKAVEVMGITKVRSEVLHSFECE